MFNNVALDVFIGLVFIFLLYSLLTTVIQEIIATKFAFRSKVLEKAIIRMLEDGNTTTKGGFLARIWDRFNGFIQMFFKINRLKDKKIAAWFYVHPLIKYLGEDNYYSKPAYITSQNFSKVMIDLLKGFNDDGTHDLQKINDSIKNGRIYQLPINIHGNSANMADNAIRSQLKIQKSDDHLVDPKSTVNINTDTKLFLQSIWAESKTDLEVFKTSLEQWYDDTMERASGWYKRYTQYILLILGFAIAVAFNIDTIAIYKILSKDKAAREQIVQMVIKDNSNMKDAIEQVNKGKSQDYIHHNSDSYNKELNSLLADANSSNSILGLGRPWDDTCKLCEESREYDVNIKRLMDENVILNKKSIKLLKSFKLLDSLKKLRCLKFRPMKHNLPDSNIEIGKLQNDLKQNRIAFELNEKKINNNNIEYNKIDSARRSILSRCFFIKNQKEKVWFKYGPNQAGGLETLAGWLLTALAISLGAPFWFDLLNKLMQLRGGNKIDASNNKNTDNNSKNNPSPPVNISLSTKPAEEGAVG